MVSSCRRSSSSWCLLASWRNSSSVSSSRGFKSSESAILRLLEWVKREARGCTRVSCCLEIARQISIARAGSPGSLQARYHIVPRVSSCSCPFAAGSALQALFPEDERILDRVGIVVLPGAGDREPQPLVQLEGGKVGPPHLEGRSAGPQPGAKPKHELQEHPSDPAAPAFGSNGDVIDVNLVENDPDGAERRHRPARRPQDVAIRNPYVLHLRLEHLPGPGAGERRLFDGQDVVEVLFLHRIDRPPGWQALVDAHGFSLSLIHISEP